MLYLDSYSPDVKKKKETCRAIVTQIRLKSKLSGRVIKYDPSTRLDESQSDDLMPIWISDTIQPLTSIDNAMIGGIHVRVILEDLGPDVVDDVKVVEPAKTPPVQPSSSVQAQELVEMSSKLSLEQQVREWEQWRHEEEMNWSKKLTSLEQDLRQRLEFEHHQKQEEKMIQLMNRDEEIEKLEIRLKNSLSSMEERERQLIMREEKMKASYMTKMNELQLIQRRSREECKSRIDLQVGKTASLEQDLKLMANQLQRSERRALLAESEFDQLKALMRKSPEDSLRIEMSKLQGEKAEVQARLDVEISIRQKNELEIRQINMTNAQLLSALHSEQAKTQSDTRQELELLRLQYMKREEKFVLDGDMDELRQIKAEVNQLSVDDDGGMRQVLSKYNLYDEGEDVLMYLGSQAAASKR